MSPKHSVILRLKVEYDGWAPRPVDWTTTSVPSENLGITSIWIEAMVSLEVPICPAKI